MAKDDTSITSQDGTIDESHDVDNSPGARLISLRMVLGFCVFVLCVMAAAVMWFVMTEPPATTPVSQVIAVPAVMEPEATSLGFRGDTRSPSQIIRAARRAQARSEGDSPAR